MFFRVLIVFAQKVEIEGQFFVFGKGDVEEVEWKDFMEVGQNAFDELLPLRDVLM